MRNPIPVVDIIIQANDRIALIRRGKQPFEGKWAIPGGHVEYGEKVEDAAKREAQEETSIRVELVDVLGVYSDPSRDPRYHSISIVFIANALSEELRAGADAAEAKWFRIDEIPEGLAFDHARILSDYMKWRRVKGTYWSDR
jgi:ADP-ribose pyrophosphatase YjhB (NUDIX family)